MRTGPGPGSSRRVRSASWRKGLWGQIVRAWGVGTHRRARRSTRVSGSGEGLTGLVSLGGKPYPEVSGRGDVLTAAVLAGLMAHCSVVAPS
jgi:hypothetical protein